MGVFNEYQLRAIEALQESKGDDAARARIAFLGMTAEQMDEEHGNSGSTRADVLARHEERERRIDEAIAWVKGAVWPWPDPPTAIKATP